MVDSGRCVPDTEDYLRIALYRWKSCSIPGVRWFWFRRQETCPPPLSWWIGQYQEYLELGLARFSQVDIPWPLTGLFWPPRFGQQFFFLVQTTTSLMSLEYHKWSARLQILALYLTSNLLCRGKKWREESPCFITHCIGSAKRCTIVFLHPSLQSSMILFSRLACSELLEAAHGMLLHAEAVARRSEWPLEQSDCYSIPWRRNAQYLNWIETLVGLAKGRLSQGMSASRWKKLNDTRVKSFAIFLFLVNVFQYWRYLQPLVPVSHNQHSI